MTKPIISRIACKAIPACIVAGLGFAVQVTPALAEIPAISATEENETTNTESAWTGIAKDTETPTNHDTLAGALRKNYRYILLNQNVRENIKTTENPELDPNNPGPHYYTDTIVMKGHEVKGTNSSISTLYNEGMLELRTEEPWEVNSTTTSKLTSATGLNTDPVIYNGPRGELATRDIDVTGTIENNGSLKIHGGTFSGSIVNRDSTDGAGGFIYIYGGNFTDCDIENKNDEGTITAEGGTFSSSLTKEDMIGLLTIDSCAKQNDNGTWTVYDPVHYEKLQEGTYYVGTGERQLYINDDDIAQGLRSYRIDDNTYNVVKSNLAEDSICYIESSSGEKTGQFSSLDEALAAAQPGDTVCLAEDIMVSKPITIPDGVSINGKGHELRFTGEIGTDAFIIIDGATQDISLKYIYLYCEKRTDTAILVKDCTGSVNLHQLHVSSTIDYGITVDSSNVTLTDSHIDPNVDTKAAICYLKGGDNLGKVEYRGCTSTNPTFLLINPEDLTKIMNDVNEQYGTCLSSTEQTVRWLNRSGALGEVYYWPSDGHAADHSPSSGAVLEPVVVSSSDHGTVTADSVASGTMSTLHVTPHEGYDVSSVTIKDIDGKTVEVVNDAKGAKGFKMPYGGVTIWATYKHTGVPTPTPDPNPEPEPAPGQDVEVPETEGGSVKVDPVPVGETATVVAVPDAGQEVRDVIVTDSEGNEIETSIDKDGNVTFEMPEGGVTVEVVFGCDGGDLCASHSFSDVNHDDWFHDDVDWAVNQGIFHGYGDGSFGPNDTLTREQAATVMYNYFGGAAGSPGSGLPDVEGDEWYTDAVNWAVENGIMTGYSDTGEFGVGDALSREQFCSVVAKAMGADLSDVDTSVLDRFADADSVSDWAKPAVAWAVQNGLMNGVENPDGTRSLQGIRDMTRAEMATMMKNAVDAGVLTK